MQKGSDSVDTYLQKIKVLKDKLLVVGVILDDEKLLHISIKGLPKEFNAFRSEIHTRITQLSFDGLTTMLNAEKESMNDSLDVQKTFAMTVNTTTISPLVQIEAKGITKEEENVPLHNLHPSINSVIILIHRIQIKLQFLDLRNLHARSVI